MAEESNIDQAAVPVQTASASPASAAPTQMVAVFAGLLLVSFFLPWVTILGADLSGFRIQGMFGGQSLFLWIVPALSGITLIAVGTKSTATKGAALFAAITPFLALGYGFHIVGEHLPKILSFGAYVGLFSGLMLLILAGRLK